MTGGIEVQALFCDEVRVETGGKVSAMGLYTGALLLPDPADNPVDRLGIVVSAIWPREFRPDKIGIRFQLPRQELLQGDLPEALAGRLQEGALAGSEAFRLLSSFNIRTVPLRPGDVIEVWLIVNEQALPAGRLHVQGAPTLQAAAVA